MKEKNSSAVWVAAATLLVVVLASVYGVAYFQRSRYIDIWKNQTTISGGGFVVRHYPTRLERAIFDPAGRIESMLRGQRVVIAHNESFHLE